MNSWVVLFGLVLSMPSMSPAQTPFFEGKTIRIIVGYPAGTTHDAWARLVAAHMKKQLPGNPDFIVQSMPGAGSLVAANYIYGIAKPDGLTLATFNAALYFEQLIGRKEVMGGKAKFGIFGDGKEIPQLAMARAFRAGDFRSGYYRDQTFIFALGVMTMQEYFAQLYAHADVEAEPFDLRRVRHALRRRPRQRGAGGRALAA